MHFPFRVSKSYFFLLNYLFVLLILRNSLRRNNMLCTTWFSICSLPLLSYSLTASDWNIPLASSVEFTKTLPLPIKAYRWKRIDIHIRSFFFWAIVKNLMFPFFLRISGGTFDRISIILFLNFKGVFLLFYSSIASFVLK